MVNERLDHSNFALPFKVCFCSLVLAKGMEFADEEAPSINERTISFGKYERQILDVLEDQITDHKVSRLILARPPFGNVSDNKHRITQTKLLFGPGNHGRREV